MDSKLERLQTIRDKYLRPDNSNLHNSDAYMVGALSQLVSDEVWDKALYTVEVCLKSEGETTWAEAARYLDDLEVSGD